MACFHGTSAFRQRQRTFQVPAGFCLLAGVWARLLSPRKKESSDELVKLISNARACLNEKKYNEAAEVLHEALKKAQDENDQNAVNYIYDFLANVYYYVGDLEKAKALFAELLNRLLNGGTPKNDPAIVEISLKLSDIYVQQGDFDKAEAGFKFCVDTQKRNVEEAERAFDSKWIQVASVLMPEQDNRDHESVDTFALYGMVLETYASYLISRNRLEESVECINRALELARSIYSPLNPQIVSMLNNFGCKCLQHRQFETARRYLGEALRRAQHVDEFASLLPNYYCNYAEALWHCGERQLAVETTKQAVKVAAELNDKAMQDRVNDYLVSLIADAST